MEDKLSSLQKKYQAIFGDLRCPICKQLLIWDIHDRPEWDWGMCENDNCDVLIMGSEDILELKNRRS